MRRPIADALAQWSREAGLWAVMNRRPLRPTKDRHFVQGYEGSVRSAVTARPVVMVG